MKKIKIFEMFSGYGGASFALKKAGIPFETVGFSEIDKYAIKCYEQNHMNLVDNYMEDENTGEQYCDSVKALEKIKNYGDATKIDPNEIPDFDLLTGGFPCQSFSIAGKGRGELDTRGTLFNEIIRIAEVKQPKYMVLENVKGLKSEAHEKTFNKIISELKRIGYSVSYQILNSKEHGTPQNRERIWFVCKLGSWEFMEFTFPQKEPLKIFLKDILEDNVPKKYYLGENHIKRLRESTDLEKGFSKIDPEIAGTQTARQYANWKGTYVFGNVNPSGNGMNGNVYGGDIAPTLTTNKGEGPKVIQPKRLFGIFDKNNETHQAGSVYDTNNISPALDTAQGGWRTPSIVDNDIHNCLTEAIGRGGSSKEFLTSINKVYGSSMQIRKLSPKECFRLMGFLNDEINLEGISDSQLYKLAGNGWDVNLVSKIFKQLLKWQ